MQSIWKVDSMMVEHANKLLFESPLFSHIVYFFAEQTVFLVPFILVLFVLFTQRSQKERLKVLFFISFSSLLSLFVVTGFIASVVGRARPFQVISSIHPLFFEHTTSFPSGHATFFFALATSLYCHNKKWGRALFVLAALVGVARIISGVHYPLDILCGAVVGIVTSLLAYRFLAPFLESKSGKH
jgi:undecaprenyl-diphosphatase